PRASRPASAFQRPGEAEEVWEAADAPGGLVRLPETARSHWHRFRRPSFPPGPQAQLPGPAQARALEQVRVEAASASAALPLPVLQAFQRASASEPALERVAARMLAERVSALEPRSVVLPCRCQPRLPSARLRRCRGA